MSAEATHKHDPGQRAAQEAPAPDEHVASQGSSLQRVLREPGQLRSVDVLAFQRAAGNRSVARFLARAPEPSARSVDRAASAGAASGQQGQAARRGLSTEAELAANVQHEYRARLGEVTAHGPILFRVPTTADFKSLFTSGAIPEAVIKDSVTMALTRMAKDGRLKSPKPVPAIISAIFPGAGKFDEKEYENAVDVNDRRAIYKSVMDANTKVAAADKAKLGSAMDDAIKLIDQCAADSVNLTRVFGSKSAAAKTIYDKAKTALAAVKASMDTAVTTDYNLDDPEVGLGGWANFSSQHMHLQAGVAQVVDVDSTKITLIHESCHLADGSVTDRGYYGSKGFEGMPEDEKITNSAHFEEIPRRKLKKSVYGDTAEFKPGKAASGGALTFEDKVRREASEKLRKAWDKAVDVHMFLRRIRGEIIGGSNATFNAKKARILELSKLMHLTVHQQPAATATINQLDIVLAEGIARGTTKVKAEASKQTVPNPPTGSQSFHAQKIIDDSLKAYGALTGNDADDKKLIDWLANEYQKPL
jgi:hypothetical protein